MSKMNDIGDNNMPNKEIDSNDDNSTNYEVETLSPTHRQSDKEYNKCKDDKREKKESGVKAKMSKNRELGDLEKNEILPSRLRSISGRVYSSSMVIDSNVQSVVGLETVREDPKEIVSGIEEISSEIAAINMQKPCSDSECCKNTAKIVNLITKLQQSVDEIKSTSIIQSRQNIGISEEINKMDDKIEENTGEIMELRRELNEYRFQLKLVSNVVTKQDQQISSLNKKINDIQQREMFQNIVITGILETAQENVLQKFNRFVTENLQIQELIPAHRAYRLGVGNNRPMLVELRDPLNYKPKIYANVAKLKGQRNAQGGSFFISDHLPDEYNENRRRINDIFSENRKKDHASKANMVIRRGRLLIDEKPYQKAVTPPKLQDIFHPDDTLFQIAEEIDMVKGKPETQSQSKFVAYAAAVKDYQDIQAAYTKVRIKFADATHVVCAYRIKGETSYNLQDYADDGEFGAGRVILNTLKEEAVMNVVVFMIRYHGGTNLGPLRFEIFKKVAKSALQALRMKIAKDNAEIAEQEEKEKERQNQLGKGWDKPEPIPYAEDWSSNKKSE